MDRRTIVILNKEEGRINLFMGNGRSASLLLKVPNRTPQTLPVPLQCGPWKTLGRFLSDPPSELSAAYVFRALQF